MMAEKRFGCEATVARLQDLPASEVAALQGDVAPSVDMSLQSLRFETR